MKELKDISSIKKIIESENGKILITNFLSLSILQVVGFVFPLITMPYLAKTIGVDGYGLLAFGASVIAYFQTITDWGFRYTSVRDISKNRNNKEFVSRTFINVMCCKTVIMIICAAFLCLLILMIPSFSSNRDILIATFLLIPGYILFPDWLFQAMEEMKYITIMNFVSRLIFTLSVFVFIKERSDYILEPVLTSIGYLFSGIWALVYAIKRFHLHLSKPSFHEIVSTLKNGWDVFLTQFVPTLYNNLSVILLNSFGGQIATGLYSSGYKFVSISEQFSNVLSRTFFPFLARRMDKHRIYVLISGAFSILMGLFLFLGADLLVDIFYTEEFSDASKVIRIMAITPFFLFMMNAYGTNGLMLIGNEKLLRKIIVYCSVFGMFLSIYAVYYWTYVGVAITLTTVWGIRGILTMLLAKSKLKK